MSTTTIPGEVVRNAASTILLTAPDRVLLEPVIPGEEVRNAAGVLLLTGELMGADSANGRDPDAAIQFARIQADGGTVTNTSYVLNRIKALKAADCYLLLKGLWFANCVKKDGSDNTETIYDLSPTKDGLGTGGYYDATQSNAGLRQLWNGNYIDGQPVIAFDPTKGNGSGYLQPNGEEATQPTTLIAVARKDGGGSAYNVMVSVGDAADTRGGAILFPNNTTQWGAAAGNIFLATNNTNKWGVFAAKMSGASSKLWRHQILLGIGNAGSVGGGPRIALGMSSVASGNSLFSGVIHAWALVDGGATDEQIVTIQRVLSEGVPHACEDSILCMGDSLTEGQGGGGTTYPAVLVASLGRDGLNGGVGGETSTQIRTRYSNLINERAWITVIWAGRNNYSDPETVKTDIATMVAGVPDDRYLVMSVLNGDYGNEDFGSANYDTIIALNADLAATYPGHYLDVRSYLISQYDPDIPQDVIDHGKDIVPSSLRSDQIHLNAAGYTLVSQLVAQFITEKGW